VPNQRQARRRILVLYWYPSELDMRLAVNQHLHALDGTGDEIIYHNAEEPPGRWIRWLAPDAIILHTVFLGMRWYVYANDFHREYRWLADIHCPKLALPQDEYDHSEVLEEWLEDHGVTDVFSCFGADARELLYPSLTEQVRFHDTLTGFIKRDDAEAVRQRMVAHNARPYDIVYRAAQLPYWFGSHGQLKHEIGTIVRDRAARLGLKTDISTRHEDTVYGSGWLDFIMSGRAIIGCESGSSVLDRRGQIQETIRMMLTIEPDLTFEQVDERMPPGWDAYTFFAISPRHLEAVITKTAQILVEGRYSGVLEPDRHYIPVRRDLSDLDRALARLSDRNAVEEIAERAYEEVYLGGRYTTADFAEALVEAIGSPSHHRGRIPVPVLRSAGGALDRGLRLLRDFAKATRRILGKARRALRRAQRRLQATLPRGQRVAHVRERRSVRWLNSTAPVRVQLAVVVFLASWTIIATFVTNRQVRRLVYRGYRAGRDPSPRALARDLLRLGVLARIQQVQGSSRVPWWIQASQAGDVLKLQTKPDHYEPRKSVEGRAFGSARSIVWDHSSMGDRAPLYPANPQRASISVGPDGLYEFTAMAHLAVATDEGVASVLRRRTAQRRRS
jgi:hypothetical protein